MKTVHEHRYSEPKLLVIHADDLGMAHSINSATFDAFNAGAISSASVMVCCAWLAEVVHLYEKNPKFDLGVHLTITSEARTYKWSPVLPLGPNGGLVDEIGYFWPTPETIPKDTRIQEELAAQIDRAYSARLSPTHVDSHMFAVFDRPAFAASYVKASRSRALSCLIPNHIQEAYLTKGLSLRWQNEVTVNVLAASPMVASNEWLDHYVSLLERVLPGINQLTVHLGYDTEELRAVTDGREPWGAAWRQRDFDVVTNPRFMAKCRDLGISVVDWPTANEWIVRSRQLNSDKCPK